jgi:hypothetical protein
LKSIVFGKSIVCFAQERMERRSTKRCSSDGSEKMGRVGDRYGKIEGHFETGQRPQWSVPPMEEGDCFQARFQFVFFI